MEEEKKKGLTLFYYPDSIVVFWELFVGLPVMVGMVTLKWLPVLARVI